MYKGDYLYAVNAMGGTQLSIEEHVKLLREIGWNGFFTGWNPEKTPIWKAAADQYGMLYTSIHAPCTGAALLWQTGEAADAEVQRMLECLDDCAKHDIPVMVIHPFIGFEDHTPTEAGIVNFGKIVAHADALGVKLGFENVEGEEYLAAIMERFWNEPSLGFCLDTGHEMCYNRHKDMLALYGEKLCHTHFNDNLGVRGEEITFHDDLHLMPTDGIADWHGIMERIRKTGYNGILMSELTYSDKPGKNGVEHKYTEMSMEEFMRTAYEKIKIAISM